MFLVKLVNVGQVNCGKDGTGPKREDNGGFPLVTINSSGDRDAGASVLLRQW